MHYRMEIAEFIHHNPRIGLGIDDQQFHQIRKLRLVDFVRQKNSINSVIRA